MSTFSSSNITDVNLVLKERTHMRLCINMLIFLHNLGNWLITVYISLVSDKKCVDAGPARYPNWSTDDHLCRLVA